MSSELMEDCIDYKGNSILLTNYVNGFAHLTIYEDEGQDGDDYPFASFYLKPDESGFKSAEQIISALQEWIRHTKVQAHTKEVYAMSEFGSRKPWCWLYQKECIGGFCSATPYPETCEHKETEGK